MLPGKETQYSDKNLRSRQEARRPNIIFPKKKKKKENRFDIACYFYVPNDGPCYRVID